jgi:diguanylate cyclase
MESESTELKIKLEIAQQNATRDPLTRLPNRLAFEERMTSEVARWHRNGLPLTMLIWDIDFFKRINDTYGHKTGDKALVIIAQILEEHCRKSDFVARFGGEEFVMLFPDTDAQTALLVANKLRTTVEKTSFKASGDKISITLSCGLSQFLTGDTYEAIFERADKALYQAKQNGRNQCVVI